MAVSKPACCGLGSKVDTATLDRRQLAEPKLATVLLNDLAKKGQLEAARRVLAFLQKQGVANVIHVNTLISATGRNEDWERCLSLLAELRPKSIHPTVVSFNAVLKVLGILRWRFAAGLLQEMQFVRSQDIISFNTVLSVMSTNRARWRDVHALMHSMLPATFAPDAFSVTCVTSCLVQNWKVAASIFDEYNGPIDTAAVNALIGLSHSWRSSLHVLFNMRANRIDTTRRSWNSYNFQRHWRLGIAAIQEPKPDVISFNSAASACEKQGLWGFGLELFSIVRTMGLKADIVSYNVAMLASAELPWSGMVTMLDEMVRVRIHPDGASYVAALLRKNEGPSLADTLLKHMSRAQVEKDATIVGALIGYACQSEGRWQTALSWLLSLTPKIDQVSCGTAISTFEKAQRWKESLELFILQKAKRIQLDVISTGAALSRHSYQPFGCESMGRQKVYAICSCDDYDVTPALLAAVIPDFDVLLTNPPFSADEHFSFALDFAMKSGKPWFMILPVHVIFRNLFTPTRELPFRPFFLAPQKKYNFKTPAPLPPPPKENRAKARSRSRLTHTLWTVRSVWCADVPGFDGAPGSLEAVRHIEEDLLLAIYAAKKYELQDACEPTPELLELCSQVSQPECRDDTWDAMMYYRIGLSWKTRRSELIWLDDKVAQVERVAELLDSEPLHLPLLAHALADDPLSVDKMQQTLMELWECSMCECARENMPVVVKPRHGANSCFVFLWPSPGDIDKEQLLQSTKAAMSGEDRSWEKECWQLSQVPRGAVLQPMYSIAVDRQTGPRSRAAPMELKVQVLFGRVVGATLNTHPQPLWVAWNGVLQMWDSQELVARGQVRCKSLDRCYGRSLPPELLSGLQDVLTSKWIFIRDNSERLCRSAGLDELRVDWLLGDAKWGPRIGELTYMGAGSRVTPPLAMRLARAFAAAHLLRLGKMHIEDMVT
eukprot:symbB.v1.2.033017.t2/scaffold4043.1/size45695/6